MDLVVKSILMVVKEIHFAAPRLPQVIVVLHRKSGVVGVARPLEQATLNVPRPSNVSNGTSTAPEELVDAKRTGPGVGLHRATRQRVLIGHGRRRSGFVAP